MGSRATGLTPPGLRAFSGNPHALRFVDALSASDATLPTQFDGGLVLAVLGHWLLDFTRRDPHDVDGVRDHVSGALLTLRTFGHMLIAKHTSIPPEGENISRGDDGFHHGSVG